VKVPFSDAGLLRRETAMRSKLVFAGLLAVVASFLVVINPVVLNPGVAEAAIRRCDVTANPPRRATPTDPEVAYEGWLSCDPAILPETFNNTVCVQARTGSSFVDIQCVKVPRTTVSSTPWLMAAESWPLLDGTYEYRTRARAFRVATGTVETHFSSAVTMTS
jgi:hypothetical protein